MRVEDRKRKETENQYKVTMILQTGGPGERSGLLMLKLQIEHKRTYGSPREASPHLAVTGLCRASGFPGNSMSI